MKLLIVDDNRYIVEHLKKSVDWERLGIDEVFGCYGIKRAKDIICEHPISFLISDIEMPGGDGFTLIEWILAEQYSIDTILLTSYADFSYAQKAVNLQCFEYLLKPVEKEKLEDAALRMVMRRKKRNEEEQIAQLGENWIRNQELIRNIFWRDLLEYDAVPREEDLQRRLQKEKIGYQITDCFTAVLIVYRFTNPEEFTEGFLEFVSSNILKELSVDRQITIEGNIRSGRFQYAVFLKGGDEERTEDFLKQYVAIFSGYFAGSLNCYVGKRAMLTKICDEIRQLEEVAADDLERRDQVIPASDYSIREKVYLPPEIETWQNLLLAGEEEMLMHRFREYFNRLKKDQTLNRRMLEAFLADFQQIELYTLRQKDISAYQFLVSCRNDTLHANAVRSIPDMERFVKDEVSKIIAQIRYMDMTGGIISEVKEFIHDNLDCVTRSMVADRFYLSPNYLSKLFAKSEGKPLSAYIQEERMLYAKRLLKTSENSVSAVAELSGYPSFAHFSKMFKKYTGMTPMEYRRKSE